MLQQTQVSRVDGRWQHWLSRFPTVDALAAAQTADVLDEWQGMGYNRRALALLRAAQVVAEMGGQMPREADALVALQGIGPSTAANDEWTSMYPEFERVAREEGFTEIAAKFRLVAAIEKAHEERYLKLVERVEKGEVFEREGVKVWKCINCGHLHAGAKAPKVCPACNHPQSYFEELSVNY